MLGLSLAVSTSAFALSDVSGYVAWTTGSGGQANASFNANVSGRGQVAVNNHDGFSFTGNVTSIAVLGENEVRICGNIVTYSGMDLVGEGAASFELYVRDGGSPGLEGDVIGLRRQPVTINDCYADGFIGNRPIASGYLMLN